MIETRNLSIRVKDTILLDCISFSLEQGKIYALLGDNGSGKTTLIRALSSYYPRYEGSILYNGKELRSLSKKEKARLHAILPQSVPPVDMSVGSLLDINKDGIPALSSLGLSYLEERRVTTLSGGEREMVYLAFLLSRDTLLYSIDEVEASLDVKYRKKAEEAMRQLKEKNRIVLASFHDISRALAVADEIILINKGRIVFKGDNDTFAESGIAERYFDLRLTVMRDMDGNEHRMLL